MVVTENWDCVMCIGPNTACVFKKSVGGWLEIQVIANEYASTGKCFLEGDIMTISDGYYHAMHGNLSKNITLVYTHVAKKMVVFHLCKDFPWTHHH